jgi:glycine cleavage system H lipoate-binding protein
MGYEVRSDLKYTDTHEWIKIEGNIAKVGITDHLRYMHQFLEKSPKLTKGLRIHLKL